MEDEKKIENMPKRQEQPEALDAQEKAVSSESLKADMYKSKKDLDLDNEEFMKPSTYWERKKREWQANKKVKAKKQKRKLTAVSKIILGLLAAVAACVGIYFAYYYIHYVRYNRYQDFLSEYDYEEPKSFSPIAEAASDVEGYELVAESDYLKLYTDTDTANIAVYDKRNGEITYSNPVNADEDTVANPTNIEMMKSQFILYYYNADVVSGSFNSYKDCVAAGKFTIEGLDNGIRYIYNIGDANASFEIPLEYRLCDDYIEASIPASAIKEQGDGYIYRIQLLRFMGATGYADKGYMVVPNGSGSIIDFNSDKKTAATYSQYIYDIDPLASNYTTIENVETARLPIFAICKEDSSVLVSVEDSASNCVITAGISGVYNDYNYAYPTFVLRTVDNLKMFGDSATDVFVMEPDFYKSNILVRYSFLEGENTGYAGVANYYRKRLTDEGVLACITDDKDVPFYYDIIGGVKETGHFLGVQYLHKFSMTTFDEAGLISDELKNAGISNQVMNFEGWFNGGYYHDAADNIKIMSKLGGKKGFEELNDKLQENGGTLYADAAFQKVSFADDDFPYEREAARYYGSGYVASFGLVNPSTLRNTAALGYNENKYNVLSPKFLPRYVEAFADKIEKIDCDGISLRDLGSYLSSDKKRTCMIDRQQALDVVLAQYELLENTGKNIMTNEANAYSFKYTDDIINAPIKATEYDIIDAEVPLYEMIVHGCINYSSELLNFENEDDLDYLTLHMIEMGASPHYVFTYDNSSDMKMTSLNRFYSTTFSTWKDQAVEVYGKVNEALKPVKGAYMVNHEIIDENVRRITYSNGISITVNYGNKEAVVDNEHVPALGYVMEGM